MSQTARYFFVGSIAATIFAFFVISIFLLGVGAGVALSNPSPPPVVEYHDPGLPELRGPGVFDDFEPLDEFDWPEKTPTLSDNNLHSA